MSDTQADMKAFMRKGGYTFTVALVGDEVPAAYGVRGVPTVFVLDSEGRVKKTFVGGTSAANLASIVDDLTD